MSKVVWASNKQAVADRLFAFARVADGKLMLLPDPKADRWVDIELRAGETPEPIPANDLIETVGTDGTKGLAYTDSDAEALRAHIAFLNDDEIGIGPEPVAREEYLWDVLKSMVGKQNA